MIEHRLIERMIALIDRAARAAERDRAIDPRFVDAAVDFIRVYADATHHGKEEDILFRDLAMRDMSDADARLMDELLEEHNLGRRAVAELVAANELYRQGDSDSLATILERLRVLTGLYPKHIEKEDKVFFPASMTYLTRAEKDSMLEEMREFDRRLVHEKYSRVVGDLEQKGEQSPD